MDRRQMATVKRARRASRGPGFSNYGALNSDDLRRARAVERAERLHQKQMEELAARKAQQPTR